ncbi:MAG TPA: TAXI family TRAP transporter solute-binding subunit [Firmicutes bacterium]|nr:TAXI family TRAP transporter solute-binding subunit [Bacillota bacterium]
MNKLFFKKLLIFLLVGLLIVGVATGCSKPDGGDNGDNGNENGNGDQEETLNLTLVGGATGGIWYSMAEAIAETIRREESGSVVSVVPGGDAANLVRMSEKDGDFALCYLPTAVAAHTGNDPFDTALEDLRALSLVYSADYYFVVIKSAGVSSYQEVLDKKYPLKVTMNQRGSVMDFVGRAVMNEYGFDYEDIADWGGEVNFMSTNDGIDLIRSGQAEGFSTVGPTPVSQIVEFAGTHDIFIFSVDDNVMEKIVEKYGVIPTKIPASAYDFLEEDVNTFITPALLVAHKDLPDDVVYTIVKVQDANKDYLESAHHAFAGFDAEYMSSISGLPLHPGAEKYYKEVGALK